MRNLIGRQILTQDGVVIGKIQRLNLNAEDEIESLMILSSSLFPIPEKYRTLYEMDIDEIAVYCMEYLVVKKGAGKRLVPIAVGLMDSFIVKLPFPRKLFFSDYSSHIDISQSDGNSGISPIAIRPKKPSPILPDANADEPQQ